MDTIDRILLLMEEHGVNAAQLTRQAGITNGLITQWKNRTQEPSLKSLKKIADYFNVSTDYLLTGFEQKNKPTDNNVSELRPGTQEAIDIIQSLPDDLRDAALATLRNLAEIANKKQNP